MQDKMEFSWYWPYDNKVHTIKIITDNDEIDIPELIKTIKDTVKEKEKECENIYQLGFATLSGSQEAARGFVSGWITKSIKDSIEKNTGKWKIIHEEKEMPISELKEFLAGSFENIAKAIRDTKDFDPKEAPIITGIGGSDGTDLFE